MKKYIKIIIILCFFYLVYVNKSIISIAVEETLIIWLKKIIPSIFPILILSDLCLSSNIPNIITKTIGNIFYKLFKITNVSLYPFIMSSITGNPSNAKYIKDLLDNKIINTKTAETIITYCHLYNPLLIITLISNVPLKDRIFLLLTNVLINFIIACIFSSKEKIDTKIKTIKFDLTTSITNATQTIINIYGIFLTFAIIIKILKIKNPILIGFLEIMNGLNNIQNNNLYAYSILLSFGGLSIIYQIKSILKNYNLDLTKFYQARIIHILLFLLATRIYLLFN